MRFDVVGLTCRMKSVLITAMFNIGTAGAIIHAFSTMNRMKDEVFQWKTQEQLPIPSLWWSTQITFKYQVASVGRRRQMTKPVLIMLGRKCAKHLNQTYKAYKAKELSILDL